MTIETKAREWANSKVRDCELMCVISCEDRHSELQAAYLAGASEAMRWIPVSEREPDKNGHYICWLNYPSEHGLIHYHKAAGWQNGFYNQRVSHWLPTFPINPQIESV